MLVRMSRLVRRGRRCRCLRTQHLRPAQSREKNCQQREPPHANHPERKRRVEREVSAHGNGPWFLQLNFYTAVRWLTSGRSFARRKRHPEAAFLCRTTID